MKKMSLVILLTLAACEPNLTLNTPDITPCTLQPADCERSDEEFEEFFNSMTEEEQNDYVENQVLEPQSGFVSQKEIK